MTFLDELARCHGVPYRFSSCMEERRSYLIDGVVVLNGDLPRERAYWAYCHELAHLKLNHSADLPLDTAEEIEQENEANKLASQILLPEADFAVHVQKSLTDLKELFPFASYEVLARRRLMYRFGLLTIVDNQKVTLRITPDEWNRPAVLFPLEEESLQKCLKLKSDVHLKGEGMKVEATYIDDGRGVIRVIVFLEREEA